MGIPGLEPTFQLGMRRCIRNHFNKLLDYTGERIKDGKIKFHGQFLQFKLKSSRNSTGKNVSAGKCALRNDFRELVIMKGNSY